MIKFNSIHKNFNGLAALYDINLEVSDGEFVFLVGPTGAGKSTLLKLIIREEVPSKGTLFVDDMEVPRLSGSSISQLRRRIGIIFQDFKLLQNRTVFENISFPLEIAGLHKEDIERLTADMLDLINLKEQKDLFPNQISGGEAQKTAIARAMIQKPEILLADEPTGNLDLKSAWEIMQLLSKLNNLGTTIIMATHNFDFINSLHHRNIEIDQGKITKDTLEKNLKKPKPEKKKT